MDRSRERSWEGLDQLRGWALKVGALDTRSLAVMRIGLGLVLLADLGSRLMLVREHYTDAGILPRRLAHQLAPPTFGILDAGGGVLFVSCVFLVAMAAAATLAVGYRTRWATLASWILILSIQNRNGPVFHSGDVLLRVVLFWCLFLPLGACWSMDARRGEPVQGRIVSVGTACYTIQIMLVFGCLLQHKLMGHSWTHGTAVAEALRDGQFQREFGRWLLAWPLLLQLMTYAVLAAQGVTVLLLCLPFAWARLFAVAMTVATQIGFGLSFRLGHFPWTTSIVMLAFLPPELWEWVGRRARWPKPAPGQELRAEQASALSKPAKAFAIVAMGLVLLWNLSEAGATVNVGGQYEPLALTFPGEMALGLGLDQAWSMFAPDVRTEDGWFVMPAVTEDGRHIDALRWTLGSAATREEATLSPAQPFPTAEAFGSNRWAMFLIDCAVEPQPAALEGLSRYACRKWNDGAADNDRIGSLSLDYLAFEHQPDGGVGPLAPRKLWQQSCLEANDGR